MGVKAVIDLCRSGVSSEKVFALLDRRERVWMAGHRDDAVGLMGCADLFIVASRNEGGPYTLAELKLIAQYMATLPGDLKTVPQSKFR